MEPSIFRIQISSRNNKYFYRKYLSLILVNCDQTAIGKCDVAIYGIFWCEGHCRSTNQRKGVHFCYGIEPAQSSDSDVVFYVITGNSLDSIFHPLLGNWNILTQNFLSLSLSTQIMTYPVSYSRYTLLWIVGMITFDGFSFLATGAALHISMETGSECMSVTKFNTWPVHVNRMVR
jgi:hypothetical protein